MTVLATLQTLADWLLADPSHIVVAAAAIAALTPTPVPNSLGGKLYRVVDIFALNFLHAKEDGAPAPAPPAAVQPGSAAPTSAPK